MEFFNLPVLGLPTLFLREKDFISFKYDEVEQQYIATHTGYGCQSVQGVCKQ